MKIRIAMAIAAGLATMVTAPQAAQAMPPQAAQAMPHHEHDGIRYASVKGCKVKGGSQRPCGQWRLVMHSGSKTTLPDAETIAHKANGKSSKDQVAPIAVSGDGHRIAYFTKAGRLAVRTLGGGVKVFAKDALPHVAQYDMTFNLSDDGGRLAVVFATDKPTKTRIFDTETGTLLGTTPGGQTMLGFSADGGELLTDVSADESVTDLIAYSESGEQLSRVTPPQIVSSNSPQALSGDGRTIANVVMGKKPQLVLYDLQTEEVTAKRRIKLPAGDLMMIDWTGDRQVTLHLTNYPEGKASRMTIVQIDTETGAVKTRDHYSIMKDNYVFAACGG
jgi:ribosomal protein S4E